MKEKAMLDAVRVAGVALLTALFVKTKNEDKPDAALVERERKRLLDMHVLRSVCQ